MPAEWEPHAATWIAWPHDRERLAGQIRPIPWVYGEMVRHLTRGERVHLLVDDAAAEKRAHACWRAPARPRQRALPPAAHRPQLDARLGPAFRENARGAVAITNWRFNGWAKYDDRARRRLPTRWRACSAAAAGSRQTVDRQAMAWSSKAAPSTSTAPGRC